MADVLWADAGNDRLTGGRGGDRVHGGDDDDDLAGNGGQDQLVGDDGHDLLSGGSGNDQLWGGAGADSLEGGAQDDSLGGGRDDDTLTGGNGADAFGHAGTGGHGSDWILDFDNTEGDHLLFGLSDATRADFAVTYVTTSGAGDPNVAEALITYLPTNTLIWILVDGADEAAILLQSSMNSFDLL